VQPYVATNPNSTQRDNCSATGNVNPYTGTLLVSTTVFDLISSAIPQAHAKIKRIQNYNGVVDALPTISENISTLS
jgi:hypothetical protein